MLPKNLAFVEDDPEFGDFLTGYLRAQEITVIHYANSDDLLADPQGFAFDFYIVDLTLPGIDGVDLVRLLRRRSSAGVLVISGRQAPDVFDCVMNAGADMLLAKPVRAEHALLATKAIHRRAVQAMQQVSVWSLDQRARVLVAPDGARIELSLIDLVVLQCFAEAQGSLVSREALRVRLGRTEVDIDTDNSLHAAIYRLRRRIERTTPLLVPLQSQARAGYLFKGTLTVV